MLTYDLLMAYLRKNTGIRQRANFAYSLLFWSFIALGAVLFFATIAEAGVWWRDLILYGMLLTGGGSILALLTIFKIDHRLDELTRNLTTD
jgi:hypothetical protein